MARWGGGPTGTFTVSQPRGAVRWSFRAALHDVRTLCEDRFSGNRRGGRRSRDTAGEPWPDGGVARRAHSQFPSPVARSVGHSARLCTMFGHFVRMDFREIDGGAVDREIRPASHGPMGGGPTGTFTVSQPRGAVRWSFRAALHDVRTLCEDRFSGNRRGGRRSRDTAGEPWPDGGVARRAHSQFPSPVARSVGHSARLCTMFGHFVRIDFREIDGGAVDREIRPASHGPKSRK
jgi:hypothetical protein